MIQDLCRESLTLRFPAGEAADGKTAYVECPARAFIIDYGKRVLKDVGLQQDTRFMVIAATTALNTEFARGLDGIQAVDADNHTYDLKNIKVCRQLDGRIEAYSCAAF